MQKIGKTNACGLNNDDFKEIKNYFSDYNDCVIEEIDLGRDAMILIIRKGIKYLLNKPSKYFKFQQEVFSSKNMVDKKAFMKGRVVNKHARYNLCYADYSQEPNYENKKDRIIDFKNLKYLKQVRHTLSDVTEKLKNLYAELNYYYDKNCGIGFHGDTERRIVVGVRFGVDMNLIFRWYYKNESIDDIEIVLNDGDLYFMNEKTVGFDWKKKNIYTLRHASGSKKYTSKY